MLQVNIFTPRPQVLTRLADSDDEAEAQVVPEAHATAFLNGVLSEFHAEQVTSGTYSSKNFNPP